MRNEVTVTFTDEEVTKLAMVMENNRDEWRKFLGNTLATDIFGAEMGEYHATQASTILGKLYAALEQRVNL